jgi:hypothetical protein
MFLGAAGKLATRDRKDQGTNKNNGDMIEMKSRFVISGFINVI